MVLNISAEQTTERALWSDSFLETIVELMQNHREREDLFLRCVTLVHRQCATDLEHLEHIRSQTALVQRLGSIYTILDKKSKLEQSIADKELIKIPERRREVKVMSYHHRLRAVLQLLYDQ